MPWASAMPAISGPVTRTPDVATMITAARITTTASSATAAVATACIPASMWRTGIRREQCQARMAILPSAGQ